MLEPPTGTAARAVNPPVNNEFSDLDAAVAGVGVESAYQPIVSLPDGATVGFEALARWPLLGNPKPENVFAHAATGHRLDRLDQLCIDSAVEGALAGRLNPGTLLLINCEPASASVRVAHDEALARGRDRFDVVFELTERSLLAHPHLLMSKVAALRSDGFAIALDDVGAHPDSLALLDVVYPDVIKLDVDLVQCQPRNDQARTLAAVLAHHERTGAVILAEGIETDEHVEQAMALGASLGQGFKFGPAAALQGRTPVKWTRPPSKRGQGFSGGSPFDFIKARSPMRTARKQTLIAFSRHIEGQACHAADPPMLLTALQQADYFTSATRRRYQNLADALPLVAVFGQNLPAELGKGVRGVHLPPEDPLCTEWTVLTLGPHTAAALLAREHSYAGGRPREEDRRFDFVITYDRSLVTAAARNLLGRMR